ncbi:MAG: tRNA preQ1(34) S-adenosylmethionine ribosyltransferase-isomerase QueA [SAR202 cluster bacterium]|jgi:S-adenosylmethionine:tRNA ribosyltransferase-isomerase|nr:tRNA preQ1(34) S-adenosylmethionine ribosyltransferase-isomerase QueA [SAR202 cluster bacterium]
MQKPLFTDDFDYTLPQELIAQTPIEPRDASRLLVLDRGTGAVTHRERFSDILDYLRLGDLLVFNDSRVIPARVYGHFAKTGGKLELLLLNRVSPGVWQCLGQPGRRMRVGTEMVLEGNGASVSAIVISVDADGLRTVEVNDEEALTKVGTVPLPPYIHETLDDPERYQTVYSRELGSAAAPTAGLHFTPELMERLRRMGAELAFVTLHVGLDTFRPVQTNDPTEHTIHTERWEVSQSTADAVNRAKAEGRRVVAVGTTSVRVLETAGSAAIRGGAARASTDNGIPNTIQAGTGSTGLFILPGYTFRAVDAMVTNFHLPRSTLLMLVSAFVGREAILNAYQEAVKERYRFFSFGDAMFIG